MASLSKEGWEKTNFPILCETCLGDNPYVRMTKANFDKECKICTRPFTVFRWRPGTNARYKKTEVCQTCSKLKNVCQTCLLDLQFGLPVQVRDAGLPTGSSLHVAIPQSDVNREWFADQAEKKLRDGSIDYTGTTVAPFVHKLARVTPYYKRNRAHICSFYVKGTCTRGAECPYRHDMPETGELAVQNMKDRYYGVNDPVAKKLMTRVEQMASLQPPPDQEITTIWLGGIDPKRVTENDIRDKFYSFGEITALRVVPRQNCAFVTFATRASAEAACERLYNNLVINEVFLRLAWGKPEEQAAQQALQVQLGSSSSISTGGSSAGSSSSSSIGGGGGGGGSMGSSSAYPYPSMMPPPGAPAMAGAYYGSAAPPLLPPGAPLVPYAAGSLLGPPGSAAPTPAALYPSMDSSRMGSNVAPQSQPGPIRR